MQGWIFDVYPDHDRNLMVSWVLTGNGAVRLEEKYTPCIYVGAPVDSLLGLIRASSRSML